MNRLKSKKDFDYVPCIDGCSECCGPFPLSQRELAKIRDYLEPLGRAMPSLIPGLNLPVDWEAGRSLDCAFLEEGKCIVYPVRPLICRGMGAVDSEKLICHAHKVRARKLMPRRRFNKLLREAGY
ncbi:MAG: YkgJ family cysteine cluster protein [Nitrospirota bacterium]